MWWMVIYSLEIAVCFIIYLFTEVLIGLWPHLRQVGCWAIVRGGRLSVYICKSFFNSPRELETDMVLTWGEERETEGSYLLIDFTNRQERLLNKLLSSTTVFSKSYCSKKFTRLQLLTYLPLTQPSPLMVSKSLLI